MFACGSEDGKSVVIFAVNSKAEPAEWSCQFDGFDAPVRAVKAEALCDTQDTRQTDVMNHWSAPERIRTVEMAISKDKIVLPALSVTAVEFEK